jgi:hypothetical protein
VNALLEVLKKPAGDESEEKQICDLSAPQEEPTPLGSGPPAFARNTRGSMTLADLNRLDRVTVISRSQAVFAAPIEFDLLTLPRLSRTLDAASQPAMIK